MSLRTAHAGDATKGGLRRARSILWAYLGLLNGAYGPRRPGWNPAGRPLIKGLFGDMGDNFRGEGVFGASESACLVIEET
jgi:hypothetical protein